MYVYTLILLFVWQVYETMKKTTYFDLIGIVPHGSHFTSERKTQQTNRYIALIVAIYNHIDWHIKASSMLLGQITG